jgi:hypothetical protein
VLTGIEIAQLKRKGIKMMPPLKREKEAVMITANDMSGERVLLKVRIV